MVRQAKNDAVRFASLMNPCGTCEHLQKYEGRIALRGHHVKDDNGYTAVFTEKVASASQVTAARLLDTIAWLPGMAGEANDPVSAYTHLGSTQIAAITRERLPTSVDKATMGAKMIAN